jgi:hypothetical protein
MQLGKEVSGEGEDPIKARSTTTQEVRRAKERAKLKEGLRQELKAEVMAEVGLKWKQSLGRNCRWSRGRSKK